MAAPAVALLLLGGCWWPMPGQGPNRQAHNSAEETITVDNVHFLRRAWEARVDDGPVGDPVTSTAGVHVADRANVYAFHTDTGSRRWAHGVDAPLRVTQPFVRDDQVLVGQWNPTATGDTDPGGSDVTLALDAATGASGGEVSRGVPIGLRGSDAMITDDEYIRLGRPQFPVWLQGLSIQDLDTGDWTCCASLFHLGGNPDGTAPAPPTSSLSFTDGWVVHNGRGVVDLEANPADTSADGNGLRGWSRDYLPTCGVYGWDRCPEWAVPLDGTTVTPPVFSDDQATMYVGTDAGTVYAVEVATGTIRWSRSIAPEVTASPALAEGVLYVPEANGNVWALRAADGEVRWAGFGSAHPITTQPAVANGLVFTATDTGDLHAWRADCLGPCGPVWMADLGTEVTGAPAVSNGQLYVGTADGRLVAFALDEDSSGG